MFQFLFDGLRGGTNSEPTAANHRTLLRIEGLEDRCTPAAFVVNTVADTDDANVGDGQALDAQGNTSLRAAIMEGNAQNGAHNISFYFPGAESNEDTTVVLFTALPALERTYVIDGQVSGGTPPPGGGGGPVVVVTEEPGGGGTTLPPPPPGTVGLTVTITRAATATTDFRLFTVDPAGEATWNLSLMNVALTGGKSVGAGQPGGAVFMRNGELAMTRCTVTDNFSAGVGGAVAGMGRITISSCDFRRNGGWQGGAVKLMNDSALASTISGSLFSENEAWGDGGGAIAYVGGSGKGTFKISNTAIVNNKAIALDGAKTNGGGIYATASFTFEGGSITGNETSGYGGGLYIYGENTIAVLTGLTLNDNKCDLRRGGGYVDSGTMSLDIPISFTGNTSLIEGFGDGVYRSPGGFATFTGAPSGSQSIAGHK